LGISVYNVCQRKEIMESVDGLFKAPTDKANLNAWWSNEAQIIAWILSTIDLQTINNLSHTCVYLKWNK